jgi:2-polyprenyl-3-methyl-5-hydroxy-6-metoxy-1,4-benzoquinol methylase
MSISSQIFYAADKHLKDKTLSLMHPCQTLLDLGCGDCQFTAKLVDRTGAATVITVDTIPIRVKYSYGHKWQSVNADLNRRLPIDDNTADIIHAGDVIEHLNDTDTFVKEIKRILKPDGYAVISTPNLASWHNILCLCLGLQPPVAMVSDEILGIEMVEADKDMPKHRRIFTPDGLYGLLKHHGLKIDRMYGSGYYPFTSRFLAIIDPDHAAYIIVKVRK